MAVQLFEIATFIVPGLVIGFFAARMTKKGNVGTLFNMIVGVVGAAAGYYVISYFGFYLIAAYIGGIINSCIGAVILLVGLKLIKK